MRDGFNIWTYLGRSSQINRWYLDNSRGLFWKRQKEYEYIWELLGSSVQPGKIGSLSDREYERMEAAVEFLIDQRIIPESMGGFEGEVTKKLNHRRKMIREYQRQLREQKIGQIDEEYKRINDLLEQIKKQENEKVETYRR